MALYDSIPTQVDPFREKHSYGADAIYGDSIQSVSILFISISCKKVNLSPDSIRLFFRVWIRQRD